MHARKKQKCQYDKHTRLVKNAVGDRVFGLMAGSSKHKSSQICLMRFVQLIVQPPLIRVAFDRVSSIFPGDKGCVLVTEISQEMAEFNQGC